MAFEDHHSDEQGALFNLDSEKSDNIAWTATSAKVLTEKEKAAERRILLREYRKYFLADDSGLRDDRDGAYEEKLFQPLPRDGTRVMLEHSEFAFVCGKRVHLACGTKVPSDIYCEKCRRPQPYFRKRRKS